MVTEFQHVMGDIVLLSQAGDFSQAYGSTLSVTRYKQKRGAWTERHNKRKPLKWS